MDDSATDGTGKRLAFGVLAGAAAAMVFYVAASLDNYPALGTVILVFLVYALQARRSRYLETEVKIMRNEIEALKERLDGRQRAIGEQYPEATPDAWLTEWFKGEYRVAKCGLLSDKNDD